MAKPDGHLKWILTDIAAALKLKPEDVREYFTDGRRVSFLLERRVAAEVIGGELAQTEGCAYDLLDPKGGKWEVRSVSRAGVYFCPSYMVGSGRHFELRGFLDKLDEIAGYIVSDIEAFPEVPYWIISKMVVKQWWESGELGATTKISRQKALALLSSLVPKADL